SIARIGTVEVSNDALGQLSRAHYEGAAHTDAKTEQAALNEAHDPSRQRDEDESQPVGVHRDGFGGKQRLRLQEIEQNEKHHPTGDSNEDLAGFVDARTAVAQ